MNLYGGAMKLDEWLYQQRIKRTHFAREIGVSPGYMSQLCTGTSLPSLVMAAKIMIATGGKVTPTDFIVQAAE